MNIQELGQQIKSKYPQYGNMSDEDVANKVIAKYPQYKSQVTDASSTTPSQPAQPKNYGIGEMLGSAVANIPKSIGGLIGGVGSAILHPIDTVKNIGEMGIGAVASVPGVGNLMENRAQSEGKQPLLDESKQKFGNLLNYFGQRYGGIENIKRTIAEDPAGFALDLSAVLDAGGSLVGKVGDVSKIGELSKAGEITGKIGETIDPLKATAKVGGKVLGKVGDVGTRVLGESVGATTGVGYGVIKQLYKSIKAGGDQAKAAYNALRGKIPTEQVVSDTNDALSKVYENRSNQYVSDSSKLKLKEGGNLDVKVAKDAAKSSLDELKIGVDGSGKLDFSSRPALETTAIQKVYKMVSGWNDSSVEGMNNLKKAIGDYKKNGIKLDTTDKIANKFINDTTKSIDNTLKENVEGYTEMNKNYSEFSTQIEQIKKYLSLGDKGSIDSAYRKLSSIMRTNNEFRLSLVKELDSLSGGKILAEIAGGQMSELLPRGIVRGFEIGGAIMGVAEGAMLPILKAAAFTSPRIMGEFIGALGFTARQSERIAEIIKKIAPDNIGEYANPAAKAMIYSNKANPPTK